MASPPRAGLDRLLLAATTAAIIALITLNSLLRRIRMSHENGIAARGRLRIVDAPGLPDNDFFQPGREFPCRLRHASVSYFDEARLVARGASIKFADAAFASPLDLKMNTGPGGPFRDAWTFLQFMLATIRGRDPHVIPYLKRYPGIAAQIRQAVRYPDSFTALYYYSKTPFELRARDGSLHYVKFRLQPWERGPDAGEPTEDELTCFWRQLPRPGEYRSRNYLKDEFRERLSRQPVRYHLQAQVHAVEPGEGRDWLDCTRLWPEDSHPWRDLAEVEISEALDREQGERLWFHITNLPECMAIPRARSIRDPASVNHLRRHDIWAKRARIFAYRLGGLRRPIPDPRPHDRPDGPPDPLCLPQDDSPAGQARRSATLTQAREIYRWKHSPDLPPHVDGLPAGEAFGPVKRRRMKWDVAVTVLDLAIGALRWLAARKAGLARFEVLYTIRALPAVWHRWQDDIEFARQRLAGTNPMSLRRCELLPEGFRVDDARLAGLLDEDVSLADALAGGRLFLLDYADLAGIHVTNGYLSQPWCLFYRDHAGRLRPVAIQLERDAEAPVFTPRGPEWLWLAAKAYVQSADAHRHEIIFHLLDTHLATEIFAVATRRQLADRHPLKPLLCAHFRFTLAINHAARTSLLAPGGAIDKTMAAGYRGSLELLSLGWKDWSFKRLDPRADLKERGLDDPALLPEFPYRDDALALWRAIETFVGRYVALFYRSDAAVRADTELQAWAAELASRAGGRIPDLPGGGRIRSRARLREILTPVIYTASAGHAAVNNGQYEMFGYIPNVPGALYAPAPRSQCALTEADVAKMLPGYWKCAQQILMVHLLSETTWEPLGAYRFADFRGLPQVWEAVAEFRAELDQIAEAIARRNRARQVAYRYLEPQRVAESVNI